MSRFRRNRKNCFNNLPEEDRKALSLKLNAVIDLELSKEESEINIDLVEECLDYLNALDKTKPLSRKEQRELYKQLRAKIEPTFESEEGKAFKPLPSFLSKLLAILRSKVAQRIFKGLLVPLSILLFCLNFTMYSDASLAGSDLLWQACGLPQGEYLVFENTVIGVVDIETKYSTVDVFLEHNRDSMPPILYPTKLPDGIKIKKVWVSNEMHTGPSDMHKAVHFDTNKTLYYGMSIRLDINDELPNTSWEKYYAHGGCFRIIDSEDFHTIQADAIIDNVLYTLQAPTREELIFIIDNLSWSK